MAEKRGHRVMHADGVVLEFMGDVLHSAVEAAKDWDALVIRVGVEVFNRLPTVTMDGIGLLRDSTLKPREVAVYQGDRP